MKIITTARAAAAAINPVRIPLIRVDSRRAFGTSGAGGARGGDRLDPLTDGGGRVVVVPYGAADSVMAVLPSGARTGPMRKMAGFP
jgi:hypothetical protein